MSNDLTMYLGGVKLPDFGDLRLAEIPNQTKTITLAGTTYVDFINRNRTWVLTWEHITESDFNIIKELFNRQYTEETFHILQVDYKSIYTPVLMEISDQNLKYNASVLRDFTITLTEQYAFS